MSKKRNPKKAYDALYDLQSLGETNMGNLSILLDAMASAIKSLLDTSPESTRSVNSATSLSNVLQKLEKKNPLTDGGATIAHELYDHAKLGEYDDEHLYEAMDDISDLLENLCSILSSFLDGLQNS